MSRTMTWLYILHKLYSMARFDGLPLTVTYRHQFSFTTLPSTISARPSAVCVCFQFLSQNKLRPLFPNCSSRVYTKWHHFTSESEIERTKALLAEIKLLDVLAEWREVEQSKANGRLLNF